MLAMGNQALALKVNLGIGKYSSGDHYAVLGLPVNAGASQIRKHYLGIAKTLHPDVYGKSPQESDRAVQLFSKLVSPAYNVLMQEQERSEYQALLKLIVKRLMKRGEGLEPQSEVARLLAVTPNAQNYEEAVRSLAEVQYKSLDKSLDYTSQLSELNLVYVLSEFGYKPFISPSVSISVTGGHSITGNLSQTSTNSNTSSTTSQTSPNYASSQSSSSYGRAANPEMNSAGYKPKSEGNGQNDAKRHVTVAEQYIGQKQWQFALKELRTALQLDPTSSRCHALLGVVYINQNLASMAKVSFQQAIKLNPKEPLALEHLAKINAAKDLNSKDKKSQKGGFFGWLGGDS
jgi:curved DNA-binding protein CbpA